MTSSPKISAICVSYGRTKLLSEAIACFLAQDYENKELIVLNTFPRQTYTGSFPNVQIINLQERPSSLGLARNIAIQQATGDILCTWDSDDLFLPHFLSTFAAHFKDGVDWVWLNKQFYAEQYKIKKIMRGSTNVVAFRKSAWQSVDGYSLLTVGEDKNFIGRLTAKTQGVKINLDAFEIPFIYSWGNGTFKTSGLGEDKPTHIAAHDRVANEVQVFINRGVEPTGVIALHPVIEHDPKTMVSEFLQANSHLIPKKNACCVVLLGRYGDLINILPVLRYIHDNYGKPYLMISKEFESLLEGVSYVTPYPVDLHYHQLNEAMTLAKQNFKFVLQAQIYGKDYNQEKKCASYNSESWRCVGMLHKFTDKTMLPVFDLRDTEREAALVAKLSVTGKPLLLVNVTKSVSSPFPFGTTLLEQIRNHFQEHFEIIDLSDLKATRIFDVIGLMDKAKALVCIDSALLHLSAASNCKTVAIVNPNPWAGSILRANQVAKLTYTEAEKSPMKVIEVIEMAVEK